MKYCNKLLGHLNGQVNYLLLMFRARIEVTMNFLLHNFFMHIINKHYFSPCSVSFVLRGEYIQYSPLINFRLIIRGSNIHLQLIIPSNIHLQCLCSTKNEKKTTSRRQFGIENNYFYSESLTQPRNVKNKYVILRHLGDMCLFTSALRASVNKSHIPSLP